MRRSSDNSKKNRIGLVDKSTMTPMIVINELTLCSTSCGLGSAATSARINADVTSDLPEDA